MNHGKMIAMTLRSLLPLLLCLGLTAQAASEIEVQQGDSVRALAARHLGDAELWQELLSANGLESVVQVHAGMHLKLPPAEVLDTQRLLTETTGKIDEANRLRASVFASSEIARAIVMRDQALDEKRRRNWNQALSLVTRASQAADQAIAACRAKQDVVAEAQLTDRRGTVEQRTPGAVVWKAAELYGPLNEGDRLRTLADSSAEILFRDESRLRMDENSQLVIQQMRANLLENRQQAKVSLISGDLFAMLGGNQRRNSFDLEIPGVELAGDSQDFFVQRDEKSNARFANYQGQLEVAAKGGRVTLDQNEGVAVGNQGLTDKRQLLARVEGLGPEDATVIYTQQLDLTWGAVEGAADYWLEVSSDPSFKAVVLRQRDLQRPSAKIEGLPQGLYYWRVVAVDKEGFPGIRSVVSTFRLVYDHEPPFLVLYHPDEGETVTHTPTDLRGIVEKGSRLTINGGVLEPDDEGDFTLRIEPQQGLNRIELKAVDAAGNLSEVTRTFVYQPEPELALEIDPQIPRDADGRLEALGPVLHLVARTLPNTRAELLDDAEMVRQRGMADAEGGLTLEVPIGGEGSEYTLRLISSGGSDLRVPLRVVPQLAAPQITLIPEPPRYTVSGELPLIGRIERAEVLQINGVEVKAPGGEFRYPLKLRPGENRIELQATNAPGNGITLQRQIFRDTEGPEIVARNLTASENGGRVSVTIDVEVKDASPLRNSGEFEIASNDFRYQGRLLLNGGGNHYSATVELPPGDHRKVQIGRIAVEDQLGNRSEYPKR